MAIETTPYEPATGTSETTDTDGSPSHRVHDTWEFTIAIILSIATVLSAWSGYESTRWGVKADNAYGDATTTMFHASVANSDGQREQMTETSLFIEWVRAELDGDTRRAGFIEARFRPEFVPQFQKWLDDGAAAPGELPAGSPFTQEGYTTPGFVRAEKLFGESQALLDKGSGATRTSQTYVLIAVMFASVLFFGGIATKFVDRRSSMLLGGIAVLMLIGATVVLATQPILFLID